MKKTILIFVVNIILHCAFYIEDCEGQWVQTNGPYGGRINYLASQSNYVYTATEDNGIYISSNEGQNWVQSNNGLSYNNVECFAFQGTYVFAGMNEGFGVYKSSNNGASWVYANFPNNRTVYSMVVNNNSLYCGSDSGLYYSTNYGSSWYYGGLQNKIIYNLTIKGTNIFASVL